uniref:Uncharacterized protein n=1 Tax=Globodera rostochiensis TaxID=31243 RepID=A0A914H1I2_GLORO
MPPLSLSTFLSLRLPLKRCIGRALHKCPLLRQQNEAKKDGQKQKKTAVFSEEIEGLKAEATGQESEDQQLYTGEVWEEDECDSDEWPQTPSRHRPFVPPTHQFSPQSAVNIRSISLSFESVISVFVERFTG